MWLVSIWDMEVTISINFINNFWLLSRIIAALFIGFLNLINVHLAKMFHKKAVKMVRKFFISIRALKLIQELQS